MNNQLKRRFIRTKRKLREIVTYVSRECSLRQEHEDIVRYLRKNTYNSKFAKAYVKHGGIYANAKTHMYNDVFIKMDIKDFFTSINHEILANQLFQEINKKSDIDYETCIEIVNKCSCGYEGLPLGLVSSPDLANLYLKRFDGLFYGLIRKRANKENIKDIIYTRYADDLIVSFKNTADYESYAEYVLVMAGQLLGEFGLKLNSEKTRIDSLMKSNHIKITGINIVRNEDGYRRLTVGKKLKNQLFWDAIDFYDNPENATDLEVEQLKGMLSFILSIEKRGISFTFSRGMRQLIYDRGYKNIIGLVKALPNPSGYMSESLKRMHTNDNSFSEEEKDIDGEFDPSQWPAEAYIRQQGYTVSQQAGLSEKERHLILDRIIQSGSMTKLQIINHIEAMISLHKDQERYFTAIGKWQKDVDYINEIY